MFHAHAEVFYAFGDQDSLLQIDDTGYAHEWAFARECWLQYLKDHPGRNYWGAPIGTEVEMPGNLSPADVKATMGTAELTAAMDMVVRLSQDDCDRLNEAHSNEDPEGEANKEDIFGCGLELEPLPGPGLYVLDHKTMSKVKAKNKAVFKRYWDLSMQFMGYPLYAELYYGEPVRGMIANCVIHSYRKSNGTKFFNGNRYRKFFVPRTQNPEIFRRWAENYALYMQSDIANPSQCQGQYGICEFLMNGECERI